MPKSIGKGFDRLAFIYDAAVWIVFGKSIDRLENDFILASPKVRETLIIGDGSGKILESSLKYGHSERYVYAELSEVMIHKTKQRLQSGDLEKIEFTLDFSDYLQENRFDCIILPFVLDCYRNRDIKVMLEAMTLALKPNGSILFFDFNLSTEDGFQSNVLKTTFIKMLYLFFRITTSIPARKLPSFSWLFSEAGYYKERSTLLSKGWIQAIEWKREARTKPTA